MREARLLLRNFVLLFLSNVTGQVLYLGGLVHLARVLGPAGFGLWNFAQAWLLYLFRAGELGLEVIGVREVAREPANTGRWMTLVVSARLLLAVVLFLLTAVCTAAGLIPADARALVLIFAIVIFPMAGILEWVFEAHQALTHVNVARIAKGALFLALVFVFVRGPSDLTRSAFLYVISLALPILYVGVIAVQKHGIGPWLVPVGDVIRTLRQALPIGIATVLSQYSLFLATMVIGYMLDRESLGFYTAAHRIMIFLWAYTISSLQRVILPTLSRAFKASREDFGAFVERFFRVAAVLAMGIGLAVTAIAGDAIRLLYSERYAPAGPILQLLGWAFAAASVRAILEIGLLGSDRQRQYMVSMTVQAVFYSILTPVLVLSHGITGGAVAAVASEAGTTLYLLIWWKRHDGRAPLAVLGKSTLLAACGGALLMVFHPWSALLGLPVLAAYGLLLWKWGAIREEDLRSITVLGRTFLRSAQEATG